MDLTAITTPFGLLPPETQKALKEHGGPYEAYIIDGTWDTISQPQWQKSCAYRVRPEPPRPKEFWVVCRPDGALIAYPSPLVPDEYAAKGIQVIHVREVIE